MSGPETRLVRRIVDAVRAEWPDAWVTKVHGGPYQRPGIPDLLVCVDGRLVGLEVKAQRPGESEHHARGRATTIQLAEIEKLRRAGAAAAVVLSVDEALDVIRETT